MRCGFDCNIFFTEIMNRNYIFQNIRSTQNWNLNRKPLGKIARHSSWTCERMVIQNSWLKITSFVRMHRKTRSAQIASLRPQWTAARWFSRVWKRNIPRWWPPFVAESYNDRLIGRAPNNRCVGTDRGRTTPHRFAPFSASARLPQRQITRNGPASIWLPVLRCVRAHDAYPQYALCSARVSSGNAKSGNRASYAPLRFRMLKLTASLQERSFVWRIGERNVRLGLWGKISGRLTGWECRDSFRVTLVLA